VTKAEGQIRIDSIAVGEASINLLGPNINLAAKYALCNISTGEKFGSGNRNQNWSDETLTKLAELVECIEKDIIQDVFVNATTVSGRVEQSNYAEDGIPGL
jgi:hypothetical protein